MLIVRVDICYIWNKIFSKKVSSNMTFVLQKILPLYNYFKSNETYCLILLRILIGLILLPNTKQFSLQLLLFLLCYIFLPWRCFFFFIKSRHATSFPFWIDSFINKSNSHLNAMHIAIKAKLLENDFISIWFFWCRNKNDFQKNMQKIIFHVKL